MLFPITRKQREALFKVFRRDFPSYISPGRRYPFGPSFRNIGYSVPVPTTLWRKYRKAVHPSFDGSGCILLKWSGMWVGIERDGYTHT